jgi:hexosaminidase
MQEWLVRRMRLGTALASGAAIALALAACVGGSASEMDPQTISRKGQEGDSQSMNAALTVSRKLIPQPVDTEVESGFFRLDAGSTVEVLSQGEDAAFVGRYLRERLRNATGFALSEKAEGGSRSSIALSLLPEADPHLGAEGYRLHVGPERVEISANSAKGLFYGCQTLLQLLPPEVESRSPVAGVDWLIPCVRITDFPRFHWRGLLLDVARHFFTKEEVMGYIDQMVKYKLNVLQLHLTDDTGWRLEIKRYPRLTEVGAWRAPRTGRWWHEPPKPEEERTYGGFYTQEDMREIIGYAQARGVTIVPEIECPGHSLAALAAYPELSCTGGPFEVRHPGTVHDAAPAPLCVSSEATFQFLDGVFTEVAELFPGEYIHVGGDEVRKGYWTACPRCQSRMAELGLKDEEELQSYFVKRVEKIIQSKGKRMVGWDEILQGGLAPNAIVMSWHGVQGGIEAAKMGHAVVMAPLDRYYLDFYQGDRVADLGAFGTNRLKACYEFEPVPAGVQPEYVLGGQGCLWTERIEEIRHAQYMTWPRSMAIAETLWSPLETKNWEFFVSRVEEQFPRFDAAQVNYSRSMYDVIFHPRRDGQGDLIVELETEIAGLEIHYTWAGSNPDQFYPRYEKPLTVPPGTRELRVVTCRNGRPIGKEIIMPLAELEKRAEGKTD